MSVAFDSRRSKLLVHTMVSGFLLGLLDNRSSTGGEPRLLGNSLFDGGRIENCVVTFSSDVSVLITGRFPPLSRSRSSVLH